MSKLNSLPDIRNYLYDRTENRWWWSLAVSLFALILATTAALLNTSAWLIAAGAVSLAAPIAIGWLREWANDYQNMADRTRRLILYADGLGLDIPKQELTMVQSWVVGARVGEAPFTRPYYASTLPIGPKRLADITAESSFFTGHLAGKVASSILVIFIISVAIVIGLLYLAATSSTQSSLLAAAGRASAIVIAFLLSSDILILWKKYSELHAVALEIFHTCARLRDNADLQIHEILEVLESYHLRLIQSPPIPSFLYRQNLDNLNTLYRETHSFGE